MEQRPLGQTGLTVSALGFGCGAVGGLMVRGDPAEQRRAVTRALEAGITYFDTAATYGDGQSEAHLGEVMRDLDAWSRVVVGTKVRLSSEEMHRPRAAIRSSIEASLRRLGRDWVDVVYLHNRVVLSSRDGTDLDLSGALGDVALGLQDVVEAGLARHAGFTGLGESAALREMLSNAPFEVVQAYFNVVNPSAGYTGDVEDQQDFEGLIDTAARAGRGVVVIRVLAGGAAAASTQRAPNAGDPGGPLAAGSTYAGDVARAAQLASLASDLGMESQIELALRFGLSKRGVSTVLVGYSNLDQLEQAIRFAERGPLPDSAVQQVLGHTL
ncbi:MAG: aldo/keto reductase [Chloroflexi bacterium]|nr:aldo/keto reductase [Chloroflexota bacterium]